MSRSCEPEVSPRRDPRVDVVMISHNRRDEVLRSLGHLSNLPERPHIILVDNASTDGMPAAVAERYPHVERVFAGRNLGACGRNLGVLRARAPYIAFCDDDTWWEPGSLRRAADLFDAHSRLAAVTGRVLIGPEEREDPVCEILSHSPLPVELGIPGMPLLGFLAGASVIRRRAFVEAGGYEPRYFIGGEEELLAIDLARLGWRLSYVPELVVHHYPSQSRDSGGRRYTLLRNALWSAWLRRPLVSAVRRTLWAVRSHPWDWTLFRSLTSAFAGLHWVLEERRPLPGEIEQALRLLDPPEMRPQRRARRKRMAVRS